MACISNRTDVHRSWSQTALNAQKWLWWYAFVGNTQSEDWSCIAYSLEELFVVLGVLLVWRWLEEETVRLWNSGVFVSSFWESEREREQRWREWRGECGVPLLLMATWLYGFHRFEFLLSCVWLLLLIGKFPFDRYGALELRHIARLIAGLTNLFKNKLRVIGIRSQFHVEGSWEPEAVNYVVDAYIGENNYVDDCDFELLWHLFWEDTTIIHI